MNIKNFLLKSSEYWVSQKSICDESKNLKLDHDMKNNHFRPISVRLLTPKQSASF